MAANRTRKNKENPHYGFLVSWEPKQAEKSSVKGETKFDKSIVSASTSHGKNADSLAQDETKAISKKRIVRSIILISLILILELVIYLAWTKFGVK
jgi:hypothetical protein